MSGADANANDAAENDGAADSCQEVVSQTGQVTGFVSCADGTLRRQEAIACPSEEVLSASPCTTADCTSDADCAARDSGVPTNGSVAYCADSHNLAHYCGCFYGCQKDSDCTAGSICQFGVVLGTCVPANCTDDTSCGSRLHCVATYQVGTAVCGLGAGAFLGFFCQTPQDQCVSDNDCMPDHACQLQGDHRVCGPACTPQRP
jgi:hypothetical protein